MEDRHPLSEAAAHGAGERRDERDLGHQQDDAALLRQTVLGGSQVHLGLAGARDPLHQEGTILTAVQALSQRRQRRGLPAAQNDLARRLAARRRGFGVVVVEIQALDLGELAQHTEFDQPMDHAGAAAHPIFDLSRRRRPPEGGQQLHYGTARLRASAGLDQLPGLAAGQLHRLGVAHPAAPALSHRQPAAPLETLHDRVQVAQPGDCLELRQVESAAFGERGDDLSLLRVVRGRQSACIRQPDALIPPRRQLAGHHAAQHLADRRHVVLGDEVGQRQQLGGEDGEPVDDRLQRLQANPLGRLVAQPHDEADDSARAHANPRPRARLRQSREGRRHFIGQRGRQRQGDRDLSEAHWTLHACTILRPWRRGPLESRISRGRRSKARRLPPQGQAVRAARGLQPCGTRQPAATDSSMAAPSRAMP